MMTSAPSRTRAISDAKSLVASASEMWITFLAILRLYTAPLLFGLAVHHTSRVDRGGGIRTSATPTPTVHITVWGDVSVQLPVPKAPLFSWSAQNRPGAKLAIVVSRRSWRGISLWKAGDRQKERKAGGHCGRQ